MITKNDLKKIWEKHELDLRYSYNPDFIKKICEELKTEFKKEWIYTENKYREISNKEPRIDLKDVLLFICKENNIKPDVEFMDLYNKLHGEGSRRNALQDAYLN